MSFTILKEDLIFLTKGYSRLFRIFFLILGLGILVYFYYPEAIVMTVTGILETFITAVYFRQKDKKDKKRTIKIKVLLETTTVLLFLT